jgi:hypothetical protein
MCQLHASERASARARNVKSERPAASFYSWLLKNGFGTMVLPFLRSIQSFGAIYIFYQIKCSSKWTRCKKVMPLNRSCYECLNITGITSTICFVESVSSVCMQLADFLKVSTPSKDAIIIITIPDAGIRLLLS